jgi:C-3',4' desaturase CrtD
MAQTPRVVVIGAGIGGLTTAALLAKAGVAVTVLEAHIYPGGCAGTFFHKGYRFDAGATVAGGFYPGGPMDLLAKKLSIPDWNGEAAQTAMQVHLPDGARITRYADERRWHAREAAFGAESLAFWQWQERTADILWDLALRQPPWPPQTARETLSLTARGLRWGLTNLPGVLRPDIVGMAFRPMSHRLRNASDRLRLFIDGQLLISAQTTSHRANALYAASALDLPRRGICHLQGGMGTLAETLVEAVRGFGGEVLFRQQATKIETDQSHPFIVHTKRNMRLEADYVVANLTPWNIANLLGESAPPALQKLSDLPEKGWGAFTLHAGIETKFVEHLDSLHHQVIVQEPLGECNSVFISLSPAWDSSRVPAGRRAITVSTHTSMQPWWSLHQQGRQRYELRRDEYTRRIVAAVERAIPGFGSAAELLLPGTPVTFQRYTRRAFGWVGGFPQTSLLPAWAPRLRPNLWMVGDSIFPGQSTAAVAMGGMRVAEAVLSRLGSASALTSHNSVLQIDAGK